MTEKMTEIQLAGDGSAPISVDAFKFSRIPLRSPRAGEVLVRVRAISLDPYQRLRMAENGAGYVPPAGGVGQVIASESSKLPVGQWVTGEFGWTDHIIVDASVLEPFEPHPRVEIHHYVGALGLSGLTAFYGVTEILRPQTDAQVAVSGAYGGVGQIAMQLIAATGAAPIGIVGSAEKQAMLSDLGLQSVNRSETAWFDSLPRQLDGYFDNVWGETSARVIERLRPRGLVALCGQMSELNTRPTPGIDMDWHLMLTRSLTIRGFRAVDYRDDFPSARRQLESWMVEGKLKQGLEITSGIEALPEAFVAMIEGRTVGKAVVDLAG